MITDILVHKSIQLSPSCPHALSWTQLFCPVGLILIVEKANETWHGKTYPFSYEPQTPLSVSPACSFDSIHFGGKLVQPLQKPIHPYSHPTLTPRPVFIHCYVTLGVYWTEQQNTLLVKSPGKKTIRETMVVAAYPTVLLNFLLKLVNFKTLPVYL